MTALEASRKTEHLPREQKPFGQAAHNYAIISWLFSLALFLQPLSQLASLSSRDERTSYIVVIPFISLFLIYLGRKEIFQRPYYCPWIGLPLLVAGNTLRFAVDGPVSSLGNTDRLSVLAALIVLAWVGLFIFWYGLSSVRSALFPLLFLLLMVPLPGSVIGHLELLLQKGSAETCDALFHFMGVPVLRHGFQFSLPGVDIEVAEQCSGIHSGMSLFIAGLLAAHLLLTGIGKKVCFALCIFPIAIFKNAVRIVTIAWLGIYVNPAVFEGQLHRQGGLPFSIVAFVLMAALLWLLRRPSVLRRSTHLSTGLRSEAPSN
jgi:exosortase